MCGISAIVSDSLEIPCESIGLMTERLRHRGPDAQDCTKLPGCHLGHTRLSIIDLAGGAQPMTEETKQYWIVFNGEIYNYRELRMDLEKQGWCFRTQSDTEVLLRAYQQYKDKALSHLNGQFAFVIWDQVKRRLFAARDRLGEKPLYWACSDEGHFLLASEIKALIASGLIKPRIDKVSVDAYLALLYVPPDRTIYENINTLPSGHALSWHDGQWQQWRYWKPTYSHQRISDPHEAIERLHFLIAQSVKRQMVADVPVGAFLSGGLDSTTVVALMSRQANQPVRTFSVGFDNLIDELPYARSVAQTYHTDHYEIQMDIPVGEMLERMAEVYDEPFADSSNIPTYLMAEFARRHVKVVLTGDGGDEVFGGYEWYLPLLVDNTIRVSAISVAILQLTSLVWRALTKAGLPFCSQRDAALYSYSIAFNRHHYPDIWERHIAFVTELKADRSALWNWKSPQGTEAVIRKVYSPDPYMEGMDRVTDFDMRCYLPGDILVKVDRAAMAHGLETRAPFLDVELLEFVLGLPWHFRFQGGTLKYLLRKTCSNLWPEMVQKRSKQGFGAPIWSWVLSPDVQSLLRRVCASKSPLTTLLPGVPSAVNRLSPQQLWTILCLGLWLEKRPECLNNLS